ncbi:Copper homeostasis protein cutC like protein [Trachymyrmex zeteki]|uniref:Copper homeostasis protein cutC homolog n=1 Tax=Mycetomoellerius zeteki TaxID=64791 RepID=A0A151WET6_9HYME|nr:PREDICTED: copper homeostasis protein cutC homolog [Trachymyrmex zeteki]XP_018316347.1 PREDICTED: copper homeostasis protein cutC homolog [Trachymyrmex zeteki]KYQ46327.1 Copper homeostasis protein cutC like protein [Trachymyrmex zeteki]
MEICIDSLESARNAIEGGASRLEVCSALSEGGLTPSPGLVQQIKSSTTIPLYAMIRIRCGDFIYSPEEIDAMLHDLKILMDHHVNGFVFGALTPDCEIDVVACKKIISAACPLPVTFSRAFDLTNDPIKSMELLADLGFERILTSGQKNTAVEGLELIKTLLQKAQKLVIMPGAGITKDNICKIMESGAKEFHASAKKRKMVVYGANRIRMGINEDDFVNVTDKELVKELVEIIKNENILREK